MVLTILVVQVCDIFYQMKKKMYLNSSLIKANFYMHFSFIYFSYAVKVSNLTAFLTFGIGICNPNDFEECLHEMMLLDKLPLPLQDWDIGLY